MVAPPLKARTLDKYRLLTPFRLVMFVNILEDELPRLNPASVRAPEIWLPKKMLALITVPPTA